MALNIATLWQSRWWERIPTAWQIVIWLSVFVLLSRLMYLPWSQFVAASDENVFRADPNTSIVFEGVGLGNDPVVTIRLDGFRNASVRSPHASLTAEAQILLKSIGENPPPETAAKSLEWSVELPAEARGNSLLTIALVPARGADLAIGTKNGTLDLRSNADFVVTPTLQDIPGETIGGALMIGDFGTTSAVDLVLPLRVAEVDRAARANIGFRATSAEILLGDPFEYEDAVDVRSLAWLDEAGRVVRRMCGAPDGRVMLWSALFQPELEPQPSADKCKTGYLTASRLKFDDDAIELRVSGSAYVSGMAGWLEKLKSNVVLWPLLAALIAIPGKKLWALVAGLLARPGAKAANPT